MSNNKTPRVALLDGGLGQEIYRRAPQVHSPLWSVEVMRRHPEIVTSAHIDFIRAGATTVTLNTYTATPSRLGKHGLKDQLQTLHRQAFAALSQAIASTNAQVDIAACLPPLEASYQGQPEHNFQQLFSEFAKLVELQAEADLFMIETMTNSLEASAACKAASEAAKPFALSFRLEPDGRLKSGESLAQAVSATADYAPGSILLNCCEPETIATAMPELARLHPCVGGYANGFISIEPLADGGSVDELEAREDITPAVYTEQAQGWLRDGAKVVGGCCEITPSHIQHLAAELCKDYLLVRLSRLLV